MTRHIRAALALPLAGALLVLVAAATGARAQGANCEDGLAVLPIPVAPWKGAPLRVLFSAEKPIQGELSLIAPNGSVAVATRDRHGGPPYFWFAEVEAPAAGKWQAKLRSNHPQCGTVTRDIEVAATEPAKMRSVSGSVWPVRNHWDRNMENLYAAWIEKLFDAPLDASPSWPALHVVLRDKSRNLLHNHLGLNEDGINLYIRPDCADLPYFLRAYFAFKMGLPYGYAKCTRGGGGEAPRCPAWFSIQSEERLPVAAEELVEAENAAPAASSGSSNPFADMFRRPEPAAPRVATASPGIAVPPAPKTPKASKAPKAAKASSVRPGALAPAFGHYLQRSVADGVHSGSGRVRALDDRTDFYSVALNEDVLRPGTVYADPYGHLLILAKRVPQTDGAAGVFLAVDAQPDGTVSRKRFWRGNFLFAQEKALGDAGFKRFRPVVQDRNGGMRRLTNAEIASNPDYGDFSLEQTKLSVEAFYDRMDDVMSPKPLDPLRAMKEAITSLDEQVRARIISVENGRKFQNSGKGEASMPNGASIFETTGAWEDFATPSRDLRLLIAMDVVRHFPDRVVRRPERYAMPAFKSPDAVKVELQAVLDQELAARKFSYPRTDGSQWTLTLKDVVDRIHDLEMAYNVNDCVELRWGAKPGSEEAATCKRRAPQGQRAKMSEYRPWFHERRRPPRG